MPRHRLPADSALLGRVQSFYPHSGITDPEELWRRWLSCKWVRSFEAGRCSELAFALGVVDDWQLKMSAEAYPKEFRSWPTGVLPGAEELVGEVKSRKPVSCFSNTNTVHWQDAQTWPLMSLFDHAFLSFEMGMLKPDRDAFEHVASARDPNRAHPVPRRQPTEHRSGTRTRVLRHPGKWASMKFDEHLPRTT